jgi:hypothetical protein
LGGAVVDILIDERPLREFVRDAELGCAAAEGHPELAGKYEGLPSEVLATDLLVGRPSGIWAVLEAAQGAGRIPLLVCECGEAGCWPLMTTLEITNESVFWRDFRQPHRRSWDYKKLGPFTFARTQYPRGARPRPIRACLSVPAASGDAARPYVHYSLWERLAPGLRTSDQMTCR